MCVTLFVYCCPAGQEGEDESPLRRTNDNQKDDASIGVSSRDADGEEEEVIAGQQVEPSSRRRGRRRRTSQDDRQVPPMEPRIVRVIA